MAHNRPNNPHDPVYQPQTSNGKIIRMESHYARVLGSSNSIQAINAGARLLLKTP
ncbi:hypothetical protein [Candidatus Trichorickettsia mobilis]|jgi:hypothetical protein|uniref:hypothetical protein n=1 Tax=Candidatus Trichorickettsia mobilis TaxID=1346319 RepID=UPI00292D9D3D|nr:hypothetical protein [Candidatus Trichorickettsia mobilis]